MLETTTTATTNSPRAKMQKILLLTAEILLSLLLIFAILSASGNFFGLSRIAASLATSLSIVGIIILASGVLMPAILLCAAWSFTRKRRRIRPLALALAVTVTAVLQIEILYLVPPGLYFQ